MPPHQILHERLACGCTLGSFHAQQHYSIVHFHPQNINYEKHIVMDGNYSLLWMSWRWKQLCSSWCWYRKCECEHVRGLKETVKCTQWLKAMALCLQNRKSKSEKYVIETDVKRICWMQWNICVSLPKHRLKVTQYPVKGCRVYVQKCPCIVRNQAPLSRIAFYDNLTDDWEIKRWGVCLWPLFAPPYISVNAAACVRPCWCHNSPVVPRDVIWS